MTNLEDTARARLNAPGPEEHPFALVNDDGSLAVASLASGKLKPCTYSSERMGRKGRTQWGGTLVSRRSGRVIDE